MIKQLNENSGENIRRRQVNAMCRINRFGYHPLSIDVTYHNRLLGNYVVGNYVIMYHTYQPTRCGQSSEMHRHSSDPATKH